jgi:hypothetical protein
MSKTPKSEVPGSILKIHNYSLVTKHTSRNKNTTLIIKQKNPNNNNGYTYLSDVLVEIPPGIVHKEETGMGATSMELKAQRNSIIVEPIKVTASSKAFETSTSPQKMVLYIGSPTINHPKRISKKMIQAYIANKSVKFKKIVVVADSLYRIIEAVGPNVYKNFFLLLDEADSFQMDSTYRKSMEQCMDIYKKFHEDKRAMVSATINDFSDPELASEAKTNIKYDKEKKRTITLLQTLTDDIHGVCYDEIKDKLKQKSQEDKIVVAYNSVTNCYSILDRLLADNLINHDEVSFLCSKNSADRVKKYYRELESKVLPSRLSFMTSAYFSGFDISERYHLITISSIRNRVYTLSEQRIKQIAGRCRHTNGLLSETIIYDAKPRDPEKDRIFNAGKLVRAAQSQIDAFNCMHGHYKKHPVLYKDYDNISTLVLNALDAGRVSYIRREKDKGSFKISYLTIDAVIENNNTRFDVYDNIDKLADILLKKHNVTVHQASSSSSIDIIDPTPVDRLQLVEDMLKYLRQQPHLVEVSKKLENKNLNSVERKLLEMYKKFTPYLAINTFLDVLEEAAQQTSDNRKIKNLELAATFCILPDSHSLKMNIRTTLEIGQSYTPEELTSCLSYAFTNSGIVQSRYISDKRSKEIVNLFFKTKRNTRKKVYTIESENPKNLVVNHQLIPLDSKAGARKKAQNKVKTASMNEILELLKGFT